MSETLSTAVAVADDETIGSGLPAGYLAETESLAIGLARAEVDQQITTAHAFPRSIARAVSNIKTLATLDDDTAEECVYALVRSGKAIRGASIRMAEIIISQWGNCRVGARVVHEDRVNKWVEAEGVFHDLETNTATTARVRRRLSGKNGKLYNEDMIIVTGNAACAIAKRNAILAGVPRGVWRGAYDMVEEVIKGTVETLTDRRDRVIKAFATFGVTPEQIAGNLGLGGIEDITIDHLATLTGMRAALKSGESTVEEMFPKADASGPKPKTTADALDRLASEGKDDNRKPETDNRKAETDNQKSPPEKVGEAADAGRKPAQTAPAADQSQPDQRSGGDAPATADDPAPSGDQKPQRSRKARADASPAQDAKEPAAKTGTAPPAAEVKEPAGSKATEPEKAAKEPAAPAPEGGSPDRLTKEEVSFARSYSTKLDGAVSPTGLTGRSQKAIADYGRKIEGTVLEKLLTQIFTLQNERVYGRVSIADTDNALRRLFDAL